MKKRNSIIFFVCLIIFVNFLTSVSGGSSLFGFENPFDYARITDVDYKAVVVENEPGEDGKIVITERLTYEIHAASKNNLFWELWRDLPEDYTANGEVSYTVNSVKQIFEDKPAVVYERSNRLYWDDSDFAGTNGMNGPGKWYHSAGPYDEDQRRYECVLFYVDGLYRDTVTFEIEYEMEGAILPYADCSELYVSLFSGESTKHLKSYKGQFLIPADKMPQSGNYAAYTYGTNAHSFPLTESSTENPGYYTFAFELDQSQLKFKPYNQYIEFALLTFGEDKHIFFPQAIEEEESNETQADDEIFDSKIAEEFGLYFAPKTKEERILPSFLEESNQAQAAYEALPAEYRTKKTRALISLSALTICVFIFIFMLDKKIKKKNIFYKPTQKFDYFREIPSNLDPYFAANLVLCKKGSLKNVKNGYSAILLSLVQKKYIELSTTAGTQDWKISNVNIIVKHDSSQDASKIPALTPIEEQYFNLILRHAKGAKISLELFQQKLSIDYENTNSFVGNIGKSIDKIGISQGYFQNQEYKKGKQKVTGLALFFAIVGILVMIIGNASSYQTRMDLVFGGFFILGIGCVAGAFWLYHLSKKYVLLTQFGEDEYEKWRGLYNFFNSQTLLKERTVIELQLWEQYLIYATAFGISEKVIEALAIRCTVVDTSPILSNQYYRSASFRSINRSFRVATRSAAVSSARGGFGGSAGYGGGGRGGGGGGGGH